MLLVYVLAIPFFSSIMDEDLLLKITFSAVMVSAVLTLSREKKSRIMVVALVVPSLVLIWLKLSIAPSELILVGVILQALFDLFMVSIIILFVFNTPVITRDVLSASIVAYLFVALFFANAFLSLELISPGSFSVSHDLLLADPSALRYFSFVTLTTLGYGDVVPISGQAKTLAIGEALIGQIYMTVLIARLVGVYAAGHRQQGK